MCGAFDAQYIPHSCIQRAVPTSIQQVYAFKYIILCYHPFKKQKKVSENVDNTTLKQYYKSNIEGK